MRCSIALDCSKTVPTIDEDQEIDFLHAPFKFTTLFRGELAKLQKANTQHANAFPVFKPTPAVPSTSYTPRAYVGRGRSYNYRRGFSQRRGGTEDTIDLHLLLPVLGRQTILTVTVPQEAFKRKV